MRLMGVQNGETSFAGVDGFAPPCGSRECGREKYGTGKYIPGLPDTMYSEAVQNEGEQCPKWGEPASRELKVESEKS